jgi:hypothetical protein
MAQAGPGRRRRLLVLGVHVHVLGLTCSSSSATAPSRGAALTSHFRRLDPQKSTQSAPAGTSVSPAAVTCVVKNDPDTLW